jgi:hypothetical protein
LRPRHLYQNGLRYSQNRMRGTMVCRSLERRTCKHRRNRYIAQSKRWAAVSGREQLRKLGAFLGSRQRRAPPDDPGRHPPRPSHASARFRGPEIAQERRPARSLESPNLADRATPGEGPRFRCGCTANRRQARRKGPGPRRSQAWSRRPSPRRQTGGGDKNRTVETRGVALRIKNIENVPFVPRFPCPACLRDGLDGLATPRREPPSGMCARRVVMAPGRRQDTRLQLHT